MTNIQTSHKTFNKALKKEIKNIIPKAYYINKKHVAGVGYVFFIKDQSNNILGKIFKEISNGMKIYIN